MPTYDYECNACGHTFELFQGINDPHKRKCPECGKLRLKRLFGTGAAIVFKGSGFYETDYRSDSYKKGAEADKKAQSESSSKSDSAKSDSKSDSKSSKTETKSSGSSESKPSGGKGGKSSD